LSMTRTPVSLLERLRLAPDDDAWNRFVELYAPLVYGWLRFQFRLQEKDAEDVAQEVFVTVLQEMPTFHYRAGGSFRGWLFRIVWNRMRTCLRQQRVAVVDPDRLADKALDKDEPASVLIRRWDDEHDRHVLQRALAMIESEFEPATWQAFRLVALEGVGAADASARLGITANAARIAKCRVLRRLRQIVEGLVD
jgi:RNA polymerase sigma-70 factor, ECF subfamily